MEVKMQTSFIPKKPITESAPEGGGVSLFLLLSIIVFIVAIALSAAVFLWQKSLVSQIEKDKQALIDTKKTYEEGTIEELIRLNDRIEESKTLLTKHIAVTPVFSLLEKNIIQNVQLKSMKFSFGGDSKVKIDLTGVSRNYDALSKQSDAFGAEHLRPFISQPVVSDFTLNPDSTVSFNFSALVDSKLVSYSNTLVSQVSTDTIPADMGTTTGQ